MRIIKLFLELPSVVCGCFYSKCKNMMLIDTMYGICSSLSHFRVDFLHSIFYVPDRDLQALPILHILTLSLLDCSESSTSNL